MNKNGFMHFMTTVAGRTHTLVSAFESSHQEVLQALMNLVEMVKKDAELAQEQYSQAKEDVNKIEDATKENNE